MNADFVPNLVFTAVTGLTAFGLGASMAFRRSDLEAIGGFAGIPRPSGRGLHDGGQDRALGRRVMLAPYFVDMEVDLENFRQWWDHSSIGIRTPG